MNIWENAVFTQKGLALLSKLTSGNTLSLTRVAAGSGFVEPTMLPYQTAVTDEKQDLSFATQSYPEAGMCSVPVRLDNETLKAGYQANQVGIYAFDPDDGEILYLIAQATDIDGKPAGPHIPAGTEMPGYSAEWTFYIEYGQADGVTVTIDPSSTVTQDDVKILVAEHDESATPHSGVLATQKALDAHCNDTDNPHKVTKEQLGLENVDNTADNDKYVAFAIEAGEARKVQNALTIRLNGGRDEGSDMWVFDGSTGRTVNVTPEKIGAAEAEHTHDYVPLAGGEVTGPLTLHKIILTSDSYGETLPESGIAGQLFFKKVT